MCRAHKFCTLNAGVHRLGHSGQQRKHGCLDAVMSTAVGLDLPSCPACSHVQDAVLCEYHVSQAWGIVQLNAQIPKAVLALGRIWSADLHVRQSCNLQIASNEVYVL